MLEPRSFNYLSCYMKPHGKDSTLIGHTILTWFRLFNASGVMESRASTRLGENVKLLTFVSIFFLLLSFCMGSHSKSSSCESTNAVAVRLEC
jgi:hypothetical protein